MKHLDSRWLKINWRDELELISPYLVGKGGILNIQGSSSSALNNFIKLVRNELRIARDNGLSIQLSPTDSSTRLPTDIIVKLEEKLGLQSQSPSKSISIASDIEAGGGVSIEHLSVNIGDTAFHKSEELSRRTQRVTEELLKQLCDRKIVLVLDNCCEMPNKTINWFCDSFFEEYLCTEEDSQLTILMTSEIGSLPQKLREIVEVELVLPPVFSQEMRDHAIEDIANLLKEIYKGASDQERLLRADTILTSCCDIPSRLHAMLPIFRTHLIES